MTRGKTPVDNTTIRTGSLPSGSREGFPKVWGLNRSPSGCQKPTTIDFVNDTLLGLVSCPAFARQVVPQSATTGDIPWGNIAHTKSELALCQRKGYTMKTNTTNTKPATRPANYTKAVWDNYTMRVYNGLVKLVKNEITLNQFVNHPIVKDLCDNCGITTNTLDKDKAKVRGSITVSLIISMAKDRTSNHEKERHILPISNLRKFFNGGWAEKKALPVTYKEPKAPTAPKAKKTTKKADKPAPKKFANADEFIKALPAEKRDELMVALAALQMDLENVA